jgi:hypothetical protein
MIHRKLEMIVPVPVPMKVQVLMQEIPVSQCPTRSNQVPGHLSRLVTFHCQKVVQWQLDLLWICFLAPPERGDVSRRGSTAKRIGTRSSTMAVKALWLLQPAKGANEGYGNGSGHFAKHKKAPRQGTVINMVITNSLVIGWQWFIRSWKWLFQFQFQRKCKCWCRQSQYPNAQLVQTKFQVIFRG